MKDSLNVEHQHIRDLINQDQVNVNYVGDAFETSMRIIDSHLRDFFDQYATDNNLSLSDVSGMATHWDMFQFVQAIHELTQDASANDKLVGELQAATAKAKHGTKRDVMNAMIGAGCAAATAKVQHYGNLEIPRQYVREHNFRSPRNIYHAPERFTNNKDFNARVWSHNDRMVNREQDQLNKSLNRGVNGNDIRRLTNTKNESDDRLPDNLSSLGNTMVSRIQLTLDANDITASETGKTDAYAENDTDNNHMTWIGQRDSRECPVCNDLDGQVFPQGEEPHPQEDTHLRCRCEVIESDKDKNLSEVYPNEMD